MARKNIFNNSKSKLILILMMVAVLCFSLFFVACNNDESSSKTDRPTYSHTEVDDGKISNPNFVLGTYNMEAKSYPKTSPTGWSRSKDSNGNIIQSSAQSGVVNVSADAWTGLLNNLYTNDAVLSYVLYVNDTDIDTVKADMKANNKYNKNNDAHYVPSETDLKSYIVENYFEKEFINPEKHDGATDNAVYMLNNYRSKTNIGLGTSQKITSSSAIALEKGSYAKISVWIKTANISALNNDYGANIRIVSTFNSESQADYVIKNIDTANTWMQYTIYVEADDHFDTTVKLALGLGYDINGLTEGTVYFDDVVFEEIDKDAYLSAVSSANKTNFNYAQEKLEPISANLNTTFAYSLKLNNDYLKDANTSLNVTYTTSNTGASANRFEDSTFSQSVVSDVVSPYGNNVKVNKIQLKNTGVTMTYTGFKNVDCGEYSYVSFYIKNQLSSFGSSNISVNVYDVLSGKKDIITRDVTTVSTIGEEWQHVGIVIKNNFVKDNDSSTTADVARSYKIEIVAGPTNVSEAVYKDNFASGEIYISSPVYASGTLYSSKDKAEKANDVDNYNLFSLYSDIADGSVALYAGLSADYTAEKEHNHYSFSVAPSDAGSIITHPAVANGYQGIVSNHIYVKEGDNLETEINTRVNGENGSYAGLINNKYNYSSILSGLNQALNFKATEHEKYIQPLMIYNKTADNYGFIGTSNTIAEKSYAKVSVTLRVCDQATANIYLVNTTVKEKSVVTFNNFVDNNNVEHKAENMQLHLTVNNSMMDYSGWVTVDFYIATGASSQDFRVEIWNGTRDASTPSQGYIFVKDVAITTSSAFTEASRIEDTFTVSGNPLYTEEITNGESIDELISFERKLTDTEIKYNSEQKNSEDKISYRENYVWAKNDTMIYAVYNTIDPVEIDPYANQEESEEETSSGCTAETDPSTFWLSFSSILLAVALVAAMIMLVIKTVLRRRKANASDAKSHYTITSRTKKQKKDKKVEKQEIIVEEPEEIEEEVTEDTEQSEENKEESYVYGDVQVFGEEDKNKKDW